MFGSHCWKAWVSTQGAVALSSAEAEFYAMVEAAQRGKWAVTVATELGVQLAGSGLVLHTDSEAAKSFVCRRGLGRMRHIEVRELWLQEEVRKEKVIVKRVGGSEDPPDLMTKYLPAAKILQHTEAVRGRFKHGRADLSLEV